MSSNYNVECLDIDITYKEGTNYEKEIEKLEGDKAKYGSLEQHKELFSKLKNWKEYALVYVGCWNRNDKENNGTRKQLEEQFYYDLYCGIVHQETTKFEDLLDYYNEYINDWQYLDDDELEDG